MLYVSLSRETRRSIDNMDLWKKRNYSSYAINCILGSHGISANQRIYCITSGPPIHRNNIIVEMSVVHRLLVINYYVNNINMSFQ